MADVWFQKLKNALAMSRSKWWLLVAGALGLLLLLLPDLFQKPTTAKLTAQTADAFTAQTEERLCGILANIEGAGRCRVMVTLENGVEYIYATEERQNTDRSEDSSGEDTSLTERDDSESSVIIVETEDGREGLLVTELQPTIRGVVVVCEGGDDERVCERIEQAVTVALNISSKRVCVTKLS